MSSRVTPNTSPAPGSMLRGTPMSTTSSARPARACHHRFDRAALDEQVLRAGGREQHVARDERVGDLVEA